MSEQCFNVLFLCKGNSARSIMAEALLNRFGSGRFTAFSAGVEPAKEVDPMALELLRLHGLSTETLRSKSWPELSASSAIRIDFVINVCEAPLTEVMAAFPGNPVRAHWRIRDPASATSTELERMNAFRVAFRELETRIRLFVLLRHGPEAIRVRPAVPA
jgi:arsenate reductase (thioredoxin)